MIINEIDEYFLKARVPMPYPSVVIDSKNVEALPVVLDTLEDGDVSVIFKYDGKYNLPKKKVSRSALTLSKLLYVYPFTLMLSAKERYNIRTVTDLLEVGVWSS